jgi:hypothetical protein
VAALRLALDTIKARRRTFGAISVVALLVVALVVWPLPPRHADVVSAAMAATTGSDPNAGEGATCHLVVGPRLLLLRYRYNCHLTGCGHESTPVVITYDRVTGEWRYELDPRDARAGQPPSGKGGPEYGASPSPCDQQLLPSGDEDGG